MDLVLWIDIFEVSISIANLRNELKCILKATLEIKFSGVAFFVLKIYVIIEKSQSLTLMDTSYRKVLLNHRSSLEVVRVRF